MKLARNRNVNFKRGRAIALPCRVGGCGNVAGYAACLQVLSALPPRPNRPDKWGRFGLGAFLNAGKNVGAFHRPGSGLVKCF